MKFTWLDMLFFSIHGYQCSSLSQPMTRSHASLLGWSAVIVVLRAQGCLSEILKKTPISYQDPALWAWLKHLFLL